MKRFIVLSVLIVLSALALGLTTPLVADESTTRVLGIPVVSQDPASWAWLKIGAGPGVLFVGAAGYGVVAFAFLSAGLLFSTGQAAAGMIAIGQGGIGIVAFLGQAGTGLVAAGQVVVGALGMAQGRLAFDGKAFLKKLNGELDALLSFR